MKLEEQYHEILSELVQCARALGEYRKDIVVTGGLVPLLYRFHPDFDRPRQSALLTSDVDLTVPKSLPIRGDITLRERLEQNGFVVITRPSINSNAPPKHLFQQRSRGEEQLAPIHGEFLTPLMGSSTTRDNKPKSPSEFQKGLNAEALRYLDLLLWKPISIDLSSIKELSVDEKLEILLPRPGAYLIQKALCSTKRKRPEKQEKDLANIFDVAMLSNRRWDQIQNELNELREKNHVWYKWLDSAGKILEEAFLSPQAFASETTSRIYAEDEVNPDTVRRVIAAFMKAIGLGIK